jgi:hypothetical protein
MLKSYYQSRIQGGAQPLASWPNNAGQPGSSLTISTSSIGQWLSERLGRWTGADGMLANEGVVRPTATPCS